MNATIPDETISLNNARLNELPDRVYQTQMHHINRLADLDGLRIQMMNIEVEIKLDVADDPACSNDVKRKATTEQRLTEHGGYLALKRDEAKLARELGGLDAHLECLRSRLSVGKILLANETARLNARL